MDCANTAIVYSKPGCPQCVQAKALLESKNFCVEERALGTDVTIEEMFSHIGSPVRTMPQIFVGAGDDESYVGDYSALVKHFR